MSKRDRDPGDTPPAKGAKSFVSPSKTDAEKCPTCSELAAGQDIMECNWCETRYHSSCLQISSDQCKVLNTITQNVIFLCNDCLQRLPTAFECYVSCVQGEPRLTSIESKLSELQTAETTLCTMVQKLESQLIDHHKSVSDMLSADQSSPSPLSISATNDSSINKISKKLEEFSSDYHSLLSKFDNLPNTPSTTTVEDRNSISSAVSSVINEEKEKSKRKLNLIIHNLAESSKESGDARRQDDISSTSNIFSKYVGHSAKIEKAFRLGKRKDKPRLLKITVSSEQEKSAILRNCTKLRNSDNPDDIKRIFVTPDLTPSEQAANQKLRKALKEKNKQGNFFRIRHGQIVRRN